jgi:DNA-binding response OmpR family regulator
MKGLILLVEDNENILLGNERMLKRRGYEVMTALTLREARERMNTATPDAIVLDIMMPDGSGLDFMRGIRRESNIPILLLTGLAGSEDIVSGLNSGGDDYLTKPYDFGVLLARIEALLRRARRLPETVTKGALKLDVVASQAFCGGVDLLLTQKEFALLLLFTQNEDKTMSAEYIYEKVWKTPFVSAASRRRRKKPAMPSHPI